MNKPTRFDRILSEPLLFIIIVLFFIFTGATTVTGEDSGSFHLALTTLGINHPPGYPLYTIVGYLFVKICSVVVTETHAVNLFSAVWTVLSLFIFRKILVHLNFSKNVRIFSIGIAAFSTGLWSQTNVAEVYSMNLFFCILILHVYMLLIDSIKIDVKALTKNSESEISQNTFKVSYVFSLVCGLAISHHYPLFLLTVAPLLVHLLFSGSKLFLSKYFLNIKFALCCGVLVLGLLPYLYLFLPIINGGVDYVFGNLYTVEDVWKHFKRDSYSIVDFQQTTFKDKISYQFHMLDLLWINLKGFLVLLPIGIFLALRENFKKNSVYLTAGLGTTFVLAGILSFPVNSLYLAVFRVYPLPGIMIFIILIAFSLRYLLDEQTKVKKEIVFAALGLLFAHQVFSNYLVSSRHDYKSNHNGAIAYLESLPKNARLLITGDEGISLYFAHRHLKIRTDLTIIAYENSYTSTKILSVDEYREAKKDPEVANKLRAKKIIEWAISDRPLVSMVKVAFDSVGIPAKELIYGFAADRKGFDFQPPPYFKDRFVNLKFIKTLFPKTPRPDHWSDGNTLNYVPALLAVLSKTGKNSFDAINELKESDIGKTRSDLFKLRNRELEKRLAFKLFSFGEIAQSLQVLSPVIKSFSYEELKFETKFMYCSLLAKSNKIETERMFCSKVLAEQQKRNLMKNNLPKK
jgi:hypothetical protein